MTEAVAVFHGQRVEGELVFKQRTHGVVIKAVFTRLPAGQHGLHIHKAGDLRGKACQGACDHWHRGPPVRHGGPPDSEGQRHTGDLGNIEIKGGRAFQKEYFLTNVKISELWGRSVIVHADADDLGKGEHPDSVTTGHSGARISCAIIGRTAESCLKTKTRKNNESKK